MSYSWLAFFFRVQSVMQYVHCRFYEILMSHLPTEGAMLQSEREMRERNQINFGNERSIKVKSIPKSMLIEKTVHFQKDHTTFFKVFFESYSILKDQFKKCIFEFG
jgi:hypothetical protein